MSSQNFFCPSSNFGENRCKYVFFGFSVLLRLPAPKRVHFRTSTERSRPNGRFKKKIAALVAGFSEKCTFSYFLTDVFQYNNDKQQILIKGPISRPRSRAFNSVSIPTLDCPTLNVSFLADTSGKSNNTPPFWTLTMQREIGK